MSTAVFCDWTAQRSLLNHDILCNQLRMETSALRMDPGRDSYLRLRQWPQRERDYRRLFDGALEALTPRQLLCGESFACWSEDMRRQYGMVFHAIFVATYGVEREVERLHALLTAALECTQALLRTRPDRRTEEMVATVSSALDDLSEAISSLPKACCS